MKRFSCRNVSHCKYLCYESLTKYMHNGWVLEVSELTAVYLFRLLVYLPNYSHFGTKMIEKYIDKIQKIKSAYLYHISYIRNPKNPSEKTSDQARELLLIRGAPSNESVSFSLISLDPSYLHLRVLSIIEDSEERLSEEQVEELIALVEQHLPVPQADVINGDTNT
ncbi:unnamed protein product, partial [Meganyctiphanes norvegica]